MGNTHRSVVEENNKEGFLRKKRVRVTTSVSSPRGTPNRVSERVTRANHADEVGVLVLERREGSYTEWCRTGVDLVPTR